MAEEKKPLDTSDPASVKRAIKDEKTADMRRNEFLRSALSSVDGRTFFYSILVRTAVFQTPYRQNALAMAFACGEQNIGLQVLADLDAASPELYLLMVKEAKENG